MTSNIKDSDTKDLLLQRIKHCYEQATISGTEKFMTLALTSRQVYSLGLISGLTEKAVPQMIREIIDAYIHTYALAGFVEAKFKITDRVIEDDNPKSVGTITEHEIDYGRTGEFYRHRYRVLFDDGFHAWCLENRLKRYYGVAQTAPETKE